ncbi:alpha/beta hydrolase [Nisaea acidiphila]|uniref:Alpha/beta hydrolase n=1 Tax=Nisaea acidiphila TaxID=1862145 RepID=A0A9J7AWG7_9PROT|nr:alpha/beta hydrolase [Nisaea acidiphila]UUX49781.1 alpha/beta hydrolase [Nisaea acidiphila]
MSARIEPITGRYIHLEIEGRPYRIYFEEAGAGIPLLCLHTAGAHSSQYRHLMCDEAVTDRFRVVAFDLPWHGKSNPPEGWQDEEYKLTSAFYVAAVEAFSEAMDLDRPVVMGCSMGGRVVVRLALEKGAALRGVIGLEGSDHPSPWYDNSWLESPEFLRGDFCAALVSGLVAPQSPDEFRWETLWHYYQGGPEVFKGDMHFYRTDSDYAHESGTIDTGTCPVYLMTGEYDYSCTPEDTIETAKRIPGAKAIIMKEMGHFPMSENPTAFREQLLPVLDRIAGGA